MNILRCSFSNLSFFDKNDCGIRKGASSSFSLDNSSIISMQGSVEAIAFIFFNAICLISDVGACVAEISNFPSSVSDSGHSMIKSLFMSLNKTKSIAKKIFAAVTEVFMVLHFSKKLVYSKNLADEFASITSSITVVSSILGMSRALRNIARINYLLNFTGNHYEKKKLHIINDYHRSLLGSEFLLGISGVCSLISILFLNNIFKTANVAALTISGCFYIEQINLYSIISKKEFNLCSL